MTEPGHCPRCHVVLTADAPAGLCPSCLMQLALECATEPPDQSAGSESFPTEGFAPDATIPENKRSFGDYELLQQIARGGMGVVYTAARLRAAWSETIIPNSKTFARKRACIA